MVAKIIKYRLIATSSQADGGRQQAEYGTAVREYDRVNVLRLRGTATAGDLIVAEWPVHLAGIRLNNVKYAEATCRNNLGNGPNRICIGLSLIRQPAVYQFR
jgi:hypothetical protein